MDINDICYINLLHDDILANILSRLPDPTSIAHSVLACKPWCHVITVHGILRRHRPPALCGVLREYFASRLGKRCLPFTPTDEMASLDLAEMANSFPDDLAESIPGGPWYVADSREGLFLLVRHHRRHIGSSRSWRVLAIFNPVTRDLQELPPTADSRHWFFVGAAILRDDTGSGRFPFARGSSDVLTFKVACVVGFYMPPDVDHNGGCVTRTQVHSAGSGDRWSVIPASNNAPGPLVRTLPDRAGDVLFNNLPLRVPYSEGRSATSAHPVMMLNMRTGRSWLMVPPPVNWVLLDCCTFVEYGRGGDGDDRLWFVCIHDNLILRLYSHRKPPEYNSTRTTVVAGERWSLIREVPLRPQIEDLASGAGQLRPRYVHSRNGYLFFAMDSYGYFAVHLRSMQVQRLSRVRGRHMWRLYPFMWRQDF